ncbi:hypothetical protein [Paenibacillus mucilaginosus]|uniref:hypothetical protein n=1 Tax=Paenibacillus mucilaginosus TaxID=61624 RepID=UPI001EE64A02|nr:hypothetical protein [Paenibacillus mucilaginosus]
MRSWTSMREHGASCRFDIVPFGAQPELLRKLAERGYGQYGFHTALYGAVPELGLPTDPRDGQVIVRPLREDEFDLYAEIYAASFGMPAFLQPAVAANNRVLHGRAGWRFYLALYGDEPAAIGGLHLEDGILCDSDDGEAAGGGGPVGVRSACRTSRLRLGQPGEYGADRHEGRLHEIVVAKDRYRQGMRGEAAGMRLLEG